MSESENSQQEDDSDEDIYKDIPEFNFEDELAKLEGSKETYKQEACYLSEKVKALTEENKDLKKSNEVLKKNLSTLLKTAQAEVQRKDSMISELRTQVDSITFRRNKSQTIDKFTSTDDLIIYFETKSESLKEKSCGNKKRSESFESRTNNDAEQKSNQEDENRKQFSTRREKAGCDKIRNLREKSKTNSRHSDSRHNSQDERHRDEVQEEVTEFCKKSFRYEDSSSCRRSYRENHRDHLKYDSYDKKRHSSSSDRRFLSSRKNSRERRNIRKREGSSERRRRSRESSDRSRKSNSKRHRSRSWGSVEISPERLKRRFSLNKESVERIKEQNNVKLEILASGRSNPETVEYKNKNDLEKQANEENDTLNSIKSKRAKEKRSGKQEKQNDLDLFSTKSPLDALYDEMITSRNRFSSPKSVQNTHESDNEEGERPATEAVKERQSSPKREPEEDWTLSFKNERQNETKPMTLYSRRMMRKFSSELKTNEKLENEAMKTFIEKNEKEEKMEVVEKEPGELTDDENIVESSKEFQELTKVASIENEVSEKLVKEKMFKEPVKKEFGIENAKPETKENQKEVESLLSGRDDLNGGKEIEQNKETREVMEFSPFKNNYKLIEISPIKPPSKEHILDFYSKKVSSLQLTEPSALSQSGKEETFSKPPEISEENELWKNSSSEKDSETELKIVIPSACENLRETENKKIETEEELRSRSKGTDKFLKNSKKGNTTGKGKRKLVAKKEFKNPVTNDKSQTRKRKLNETEEENSKVKKPKTDINERARKNKRDKKNSKSEPDAKHEPETKLENEKDDISSFEFFKPISKAQTAPQTPAELDKATSATTDYKMTATMSVTGVVRLETPNKCVEKLKNLMINEQMIFNVLESKNNSQFSPLIGSKYIEMTPRRMLKNDLMLTDSEDDSVIKKNTTESEEAEEEEDQISGFENSDCESDSGASDFVDLL